MSKNQKNNKYYYCQKSILILITIFLISFINFNSFAQINASDYAPILYFENKEECYPVDVNYHLNNSILETIDIQGSSVQYYNNIHGTINDNGVIDNYKSQSGYNKKVYYREYSSGENIVIQYWFFYAFNKGELNRHEGDWEMVQIVFNNNDPSWVGYSQHFNGQRVTWNQVDREGNNFKVYVARGSHANYLRLYSGKFGIASDYVGQNGLILHYGDYELEELSNQSWLNFEGLFGEINSEEDIVLGLAGPEGPKFRENGAMWDNPISWGENLFAANDSVFILEWLIYNFVIIYLILTAIIIAFIAFRIYHNHKKYGLGPRILSIFYIKGMNLYSIGNILCIIGIILAFIGLFNPWYNISYKITGTAAGAFETKGMTDLIKLDGINGLHIVIPGTNGPMPLGSFVFPFSLIIAIGLIFLIIATIGVPFSKKLGKKYIWRGIKVIIPFILLIVVIIALGSFIPSLSKENDITTNYISDTLGTISESPLSGQKTTYIPMDNPVTINFKWGLGIGAWLLLFSGIVLIVSGVFEIISDSKFYQTKIPMLIKGKKVSEPNTVIPNQETQSKTNRKDTKSKTESNFCSECGSQLEENATFCGKCGKKL